MNISHKRKWIYVAINKSGSSSMGSYLRNYSDENFLGPKKGKALGHHSKIKQARDYLLEKGFDFDEYFIFTVVRNPWSREFSMFNYRRKRYDLLTASNAFSRLSRSRQNKLKSANKYVNFKSYFLNKVERNDLSDSPRRFLAIDGEVKVDCTLKLENIDDSLHVLSQRTGIIPGEFPCNNSRDDERVKLNSIYDDEMIAASLKFFEWEIKKFDYTFDDCCDIKV